MKFALAALVAVLVSVPAVLMFLSTGTLIAVNPPVTVIGQETPVRIELRNAHGIRDLKIAVEQNGKRYPVFTESKPTHRFLFLSERNGVRDVVAHAGKKDAPALVDGKAQLIIDATSNDLRGQVDTKTIDVDVITAPPRVTTDSAQHYINQGGSELVVFTPTGYWT